MSAFESFAVVGAAQTVVTIAVVAWLRQGAGAGAAGAAPRGRDACGLLLGAALAVGLSWITYAVMQLFGIEGTEQSVVQVADEAAGLGHPGGGGDRGGAPGPARRRAGLPRRPAEGAAGPPLSRGGAGSISAAAFALVHLALDPNALAAVPSLFVMGLVLAATVRQTGGLGLAIATHTGFNLVGVLALLLYLRAGPGARGASPGVRRRDRWEEPLPESLMDRPQWIAAALVVAAAALAGLWYAGRSPAPPPLAVDPGGGGGRTITVHVSGAVQSPGVVRVAAGARVGEAIAAAGGALPEADLGRVNLAAPLADGQQLSVPRVSADGEAAAVAGDGRVRLNLAGVEELEALPGVGPVLAERIVAYREEHGPFAVVEDLLDVPGIGEGKLAALRDAVLVP